MKHSINLALMIITLLLSGSACHDKTEDPKPSHEQLQVAILIGINQHRVSQGLVALKENDILDRIATEHSTSMANGEIPLSHEGFVQRFEQASKETGASAIGENVGSNYADADELVSAWLASEENRENIESDYTHVGIGIADDADGNRFFTQLLARI
ncbi:CAP domain-containing protein [Marinoscillum sp.]|uniref:CAP domain-containing protein n=1 Tax=Marinoscillum sp. TaxID=2024838 RepID=UPI003BAD530E